LPPLVVAQGSGPNACDFSSDERSWGSGRSVLFQDASVYVGRGKFWRQDSAGNTSGPY